MKNITGIEGRVLHKYIKGKIVDPEDEFYIERMALTGLMNTGYDLDEDKMTAKTTRLGISSIGGLLDDGDNYVKYFLRGISSKGKSFYNKISKLVRTTTSQTL